MSKVLPEILRLMRNFSIDTCRTFELECLDVTLNTSSILKFHSNWESKYLNNNFPLLPLREKHLAQPWYAQ
jgi:hypothetical protein